MRLATLFLALVFATGAVAQETPSDADSAAVRDVILSQLDAFNRDDGATAFGFAAPGIQAKFQSVETFMAMVRGAYGPVYRSLGADFVALTSVGDRLVQDVVVTGQDGLSVMATYILARQGDGSWKIEGCTLRELPDLSV